MEKLKKRIIEEGIIVNENVLQVNSFLNQKVDPELMNEIGQNFAEHFKNHNITKIITIESSGIAPAILTGLHLNVPVIFARKSDSILLNNNLLQAPIFSYTKEQKYAIRISKDFINEDDRILFIDDFLANGQGLLAIQNIVKQANATLVGAGIVIEKSFQAGVQHAKDENIEVYSLARIKKLYANQIEFEE